MKKWYFICFVLVTFVVSGQNVLKGHIKNANGEVVKYVNVGVKGTQKGVVSDDKGFFSLEGINLKKSDSIYFSHISYKHKLLAAKDITSVITLENQIIDIPETTVVVNSPKIRTLKEKGVRMPGVIISYSSEDREYGEVGDFINLNESHRLTEIEVNILKNTFDRAILRLNVFQTGENHSFFTPLLTEPIYIEIPRSEKPQKISKKMSHILPKGIVWVGVELVDFQGTAHSVIEMGARATGSWVRFGNDVKKAPLGVGIPFSLKGYSLETK